VTRHGRAPGGGAGDMAKQGWAGSAASEGRAGWRDQVGAGGAPCWQHAGQGAVQRAGGRRHGVGTGGGLERDGRVGSRRHRFAVPCTRVFSALYYRFYGLIMTGSARDALKVYILEKKAINILY
jgi:hypothetical protein